MVAIYFPCEGLAIPTINIKTETGKDSGKKFAKERSIKDPWKEADTTLQPRPKLITDSVGRIMYGAFREQVKQSDQWEWTEEKLEESKNILKTMKWNLKKFLKRNK